MPGGLTILSRNIHFWRFLSWTSFMSAFAEHWFDLILPLGLARTSLRLHLCFNLYVKTYKDSYLSHFLKQLFSLFVCFSICLPKQLHPHLWFGWTLPKSSHCSPGQRWLMLCMRSVLCKAFSKLENTCNRALTPASPLGPRACVSRDTCSSVIFPWWPCLLLGPCLIQEYFFLAFLRDISHCSLRTFTSFWGLAPPKNTSSWSFTSDLLYQLCPCFDTSFLVCVTYSATLFAGTVTLSRQGGREQKSQIISSLKYYF